MSDEPPSLIPVDDDASHIGTIISEHGSDAPVNPVTESQMVRGTVIIINTHLL